MGRVIDLMLLVSIAAIVALVVIGWAAGADILPALGLPGLPKAGTGTAVLAGMAGFALGLMFKLLFVELPAQVWSFLVSKRHWMQQLVLLCAAIAVLVFI